MCLFNTKPYTECVSVNIVKDIMYRDSKVCFYGNQQHSYSVRDLDNPIHVIWINTWKVNLLTITLNKHS